MLEPITIHTPNVDDQTKDVWSRVFVEWLLVHVLAALSYFLLILGAYFIPYLNVSNQIYFLSLRHRNGHYVFISFSICLSVYTVPRPSVSHGYILVLYLIYLWHFSYSGKGLVIKGTLGSSGIFCQSDSQTRPQLPV